MWGESHSSPSRLQLLLDPRLSGQVLVQPSIQEAPLREVFQRHLTYVRQTYRHRREDPTSPTDMRQTFSEAPGHYKPYIPIITDTNPREMQGGDG